jgi:hypothetical protein
LAVLFFAGALQGNIKTIKLNTQQKQEITAQSADLGNAKVPKGTNNNKAITQAYHESFISAYANIMRISAGLGFLGALMAVGFIRDKAVKK